jgi:hypothetical protein
VVNHDKRTKGWHTGTLRVSHVNQINEIIQWIESNIDACEKHTYYSVVSGGAYIEFRFRYTRDYEWFVLRWM